MLGVAQLFWSGTQSRIVDTGMRQKYFVAVVFPDWWYFVASDYNISFSQSKISH
jgi:hypothetical protein